MGVVLMRKNCFMVQGRPIQARYTNQTRDLIFVLGGISAELRQGTYFAVKASYSDRNYAHIASDDSRVLLLAKVATGESKHMPNAENLKLPPLKPGKKIERYDTVHATTGGSDVYVVYDHEKAYPAYVITYHN